MYLYHFGLNQLPFALTPNTQFYVDLSSHRQAGEVLKTALQMGEGFIKVVGEVGTGKTLLCRKLLNELPDGFAAAYIPDPNLTPAGLRWALATELGLSPSSEMSDPQLMQLLKRQLLALSACEQSIVLIIDEAQALPFETLEALRLLTNLETESRKLLQVVLFGQPELEEHLAHNELRQLRQRIAFSYKLEALNQNEMVNYIQFRLSVAGCRFSLLLFDESVHALIFSASRGIPRLVNLICHKSLMLAFGEGEQQVRRNHVIQSILDTEDAELVEPSTKSYGLAIALALVLIVIAAVIIGFEANLASWSQEVSLEGF